MDPRLKRLGRELAHGQERELATFDLDAQRSRFLLYALDTAQRRGRPTPLRTAALALCAAAAVVLGIWFHAPQLSFDVAGVNGREGEWIAAPALTSLPLTFSDGSQLVLRAKARARVVDSSEQGARIVLERGKLSARVAHRIDTRWRVDAGPFEVHVVGTQFDVAWEDERFELLLHEGVVRIVGPTIPQGRTISAGGRFRVSLAPSPRVTLAAAIPAPTVQELVVAKAASDPGASRARNQLATSFSSWRKLAAEGAHERAWSALTGEGFDLVVSRVGPSDLTTVADIARFTHHTAHARSALNTLRVRFASSIEAGEAAFLLGRLAFDQQAAPADAARWFSAYLAEQPNGAFAREASGRLIECYERLDDAAHVRQSAQHYLVAYPAGPHQALARAVLARTNSDRIESR